MEEINSNSKTDFASDKFGDIIQNSFKVLNWIKTENNQLWIKRILTSGHIISMTNRIMNNRSFKPDKFNKDN